MMGNILFALLIAYATGVVVRAMFGIRACVDRCMDLMGAVGVIVGPMLGWLFALGWPVELAWWAWTGWRVEPQDVLGSAGGHLVHVADAMDEQKKRLAQAEYQKNLDLVTNWTPPDMVSLVRNARATAGREEEAARRARMRTELQALYREHLGPTGWIASIENSETTTARVKASPKYAEIIARYAKGGPV